MNAQLDHPRLRSKFSILGFPCNQFGHQEPGDNSTEILNGLYYVRPGQRFQPHKRLHMMLKGDVNGEKENPLFTYLKASCPQPTTASFEPKENFWDPIQASDITWNFEKFIVSSKGVPLYRFPPGVEPFELQDILYALTSPLFDIEEQEKDILRLLEELDRKVGERRRREKKQ